MTGVEISVAAFQGDLARRVACALGIHKVKEGPVSLEGGPHSIRYCIWCGTSDDARWTLAGPVRYSNLAPWISLVHYRASEVVA